MWYEELFFKLVDVLKWPAVAIIALSMFRSALVGLFSRAKSAAFGDKSVEFVEPTALASEQKKQSEVASVEQAGPPSQEGPPPPPNEAIEPFEARIKDAVAQSHASDQVKLAWLVRGLSIEQIRRIHEVNYRLILGSQLALLLKLNTGRPVKPADAMQVYDQAKANFPAIYTNFSFDDWISWPKNAGLTSFVGDSAERVVNITAAGKDFLHYLVEQGLTGEKMG